MLSSVEAWWAGPLRASAAAGFQPVVTMIQLSAEYKLKAYNMYLTRYAALISREQRYTTTKVCHPERSEGSIRVPVEEDASTVQHDKIFFEFVV